MVTHRAHVQIFFEEWRHLDEEHLEGLKKRRDRYYQLRPRHGGGGVAGGR